MTSGSPSAVAAAAGAAGAEGAPASSSESSEMVALEVILDLGALVALGLRGLAEAALEVMVVPSSWIIG